MSILKDSGNRREFETGAVRDMAEGKGRYDLLPWYGIREVALQCEYGAVKYGERNVDKGIPQKFLIDSAFRHLAKHTCGETDEDHLRAAGWNILWALQQRTTHPELIEAPFPGAIETNLNLTIDQLYEFHEEAKKATDDIYPINVKIPGPLEPDTVKYTHACDCVSDCIHSQTKKEGCFG